MKSEDQREREMKDLEAPLIDLEKEDDDKGKPEEEEEEEDPDDPDVILETHAALHGLPQDCPFTFLYLSSDDSIRVFTFLYLSSDDSIRDESLDSLTSIPPSSDDLHCLQTTR